MHPENKQKEILLEILAQNQKTCSYAFNKITPENADWRLNEETASVGFIFRHVGEMALLFCQFLGVPTDVQDTTSGKTDTGQHYNVEESRLLVEQGFERLKKLIESSDDAPAATPAPGSVSKIKLFSHIMFHNVHHAGQISLTLAKGKKPADVG